MSSPPLPRRTASTTRSARLHSSPTSPSTSTSQAGDSQSDGSDTDNSTESSSHRPQELSAYEQKLLDTKPSALNEEQRIARRKLQNRLASSVSRTKKREGYTALAAASNNLVQDMQDCKATVLLLRAQVNELLDIIQQLGGLNPLPATNQSNKKAKGNKRLVETFFKYSQFEPAFSPDSVCTSLALMGIRPDLIPNKQRKARQSKAKSAAPTSNQSTVLLVGDDSDAGNEDMTDSYSTTNVSVAPSMGASVSSRKSRAPSVPSSIDPWELALRFQAECILPTPNFTNAASTTAPTTTTAAPSNPQSSKTTPIASVDHCRPHPIRRSSRRLVTVVTNNSQDSACDQSGTDSPPHHHHAGANKRNRSKHFVYQEDHQSQLQQAPPMPFGSLEMWNHATVQANEHWAHLSSPQLTSPPAQLSSSFPPATMGSLAAINPQQSPSTNPTPFEFHLQPFSLASSTNQTIPDFTLNTTINLQTFETATGTSHYTTSTATLKPPHPPQFTPSFDALPTRPDFPYQSLSDPNSTSSPPTTPDHAPLFPSHQHQFSSAIFSPTFSTSTSAITSHLPPLSPQFLPTFDEESDVSFSALSIPPQFGSI